MQFWAATLHTVHSRLHAICGTEPSEEWSITQRLHNTNSMQSAVNNNNTNNSDMQKPPLHGHPREMQRIRRLQSLIKPY